MNNDDLIHGIIVFQPLPKHIDSKKARALLSAKKDIDGYSIGSLAGVFSETGIGFCPCTAQAVIEILDYYGIDCKGKKAVVIGRSLTVGRPVAMKLLQKNATVTVCHSKTKDIAPIAKQADILVACAGHMNSIGSEFFNSNQTVIDIGIGWDLKSKKLCGDVDFEKAKHIVANITPVPGGVGSVTTSLLAAHVVDAAGRAQRKNVYEIKEIE